ncbi:MAG: SsrA-binding protein [Candidatus Levybacteria bacterium RIFCSPHIGHO2_01_FULL_36_15]|nr:MAG: SsrA-binding protein [Candidatus Levybacteria bacterium RIFCSPHIGHO2_01_FULL_36_15]
MKIFNKNAPSSYAIIEKIESGIVLLGSEVKAIKEGHADLSGSYVKILGSEAYLVNAKVFPYKYARAEGYQEDRTRKLLLHKKEILVLKGRLTQANYTIIPLSIYIHNGIIKLELALARGRKTYEKKRVLKERDLQREAEQDLKNMGKM